MRFEGVGVSVLTTTAIKRELFIDRFLRPQTKFARNRVMKNLCHQFSSNKHTFFLFGKKFPDLSQRKSTRRRAQRVNEMKEKRNFRFLLIFAIARRRRCL